MSSMGVVNQCDQLHLTGISDTHKKTNKKAKHSQTVVILTKWESIEYME